MIKIDMYSEENSIEIEGLPAEILAELCTLLECIENHEKLKESWSILFKLDKI